MAAEKELTKQQRDPHAGLVRCRNRIQQALGKIVYEQELKENPGLDDEAKRRLLVDTANATRKDAAAKCNHLTDEQVELILTEGATDTDVLDIVNGVKVPEPVVEEEKPTRSRRK